MFQRQEADKPYSSGVSTDAAQAQIYSGPVGEIRRRMDNAYYATRVTTKNPALWFHYYGDPSENQFIKDFTFLVAKCQELEKTVQNMTFLLESEGVSRSKIEAQREAEAQAELMAEVENDDDRREV